MASMLYFPVLAVWLFCSFSGCGLDLASTTVPSCLPSSTPCATHTQHAPAAGGGGRRRRQEASTKDATNIVMTSFNIFHMAFNYGQPDKPRYAGGAGFGAPQQNAFNTPAPGFGANFGGQMRSHLAHKRLAELKVSSLPLPISSLRPLLGLHPLSDTQAPVSVFLNNMLFLSSSNQRLLIII